MSRVVVMVGTSLETRGGVSAVVAVYREQGLFERAGVVYLASHRDGGAVAKLSTLASAWCRFLVLLLTRRIGLLHIHSASRASFWRKSLFMVPALLLGVPTIFHLHGGGFAQFYEKECGPRRQAFIRWVLARSRAVIVLSSGWKQWVHGIVPAARVSVVYNPVVVPPLRELPRTEPIVLCLGKLGQPKGTFDLLEAVARLRARGVEVHLRLAGDGEVEAARRRAAELGLADKVDLLGWIGPEERLRELAAARVLTLPSYFEGLPMSILEAMAAGLPVVTTPVGGIPDAVRDGIDGHLVAPGDIDALADRLGELLARPAQAREMGRVAHARVRDEFSADVLVPRIEALYRQVLATP